MRVPDSRTGSFMAVRCCLGPCNGKTFYYGLGRARQSGEPADGWRTRRHYAFLAWRKLAIISEGLGSRRECASPMKSHDRKRQTSVLIRTKIRGIALSEFRELL